MMDYNFKTQKTTTNTVVHNTVEINMTCTIILVLKSSSKQIYISN